MPTINVHSRAPNMTFPPGTEKGPMYGKTPYTQAEADYFRQSQGPYAQTFRDLAKAFGEIRSGVLAQKQAEKDYYRDRKQAEAEYGRYRIRKEEEVIKAKEREEKAAIRQQAQETRQMERQAHQRRLAIERGVGRASLIGNVIELGAAGNVAGAIAKGGRLGGYGLGYAAGGPIGGLVGEVIGEILGATIGMPSSAWNSARLAGSTQIGAYELARGGRFSGNQLFQQFGPNNTQARPWMAKFGLTHEEFMQDMLGTMGGLTLRNPQQLENIAQGFQKSAAFAGLPRDAALQFLKQTIGMGVTSEGHAQGTLTVLSRLLEDAMSRGMDKTRVIPSLLRNIEVLAKSGGAFPGLLPLAEMQARFMTGGTPAAAAQVYAENFTSATQSGMKNIRGNPALYYASLMSPGIRKAIISKAGMEGLLGPGIFQSPTTAFAANSIIYSATHGRQPLAIQGLVEGFSAQMQTRGMPSLMQSFPLWGPGGDIQAQARYLQMMFPSMDLNTALEYLRTQGQGAQLSEATGSEIFAGYLSGSTKTNAIAMVRDLVKQGVPLNRAIDMAGNAMQESGLNLRAKGGGLYQISDPARRAAFKSAFGHFPEQGSLHENNAYMAGELSGAIPARISGYGRAAGQKFMSSNAPAGGMATFFSQNMERPNALMASNYKRTQYAMSIADAFGQLNNYPEKTLAAKTQASQNEFNLANVALTKIVPVARNSAGWVQKAADALSELSSVLNTVVIPLPGTVSFHTPSRGRMSGISSQAQ